MRMYLFLSMSKLYVIFCVLSIGRIFFYGGHMKILRSLIAVLAIGAATMSTANARDSFSLGINIGGFGYAPPPVAYYPPPVVYAPTAYYYEPVRSYYAAPIVSYRYYSGGHYDRGYDRHHARQGWGNGHRGHNDGHRGGHRGGDHRGHR